MTPRGGGQRPIKGFRPGKEPPQLKKQRAKQRYGEVSGAQEKLIEVFAERTPEESRTLLRRWRIGFLSGAVGLGVAAVALAFWSWIAAAVAGVLAVVLLVLWWRLNRQREALEVMADEVSRA